LPVVLAMSKAFPALTFQLNYYEMRMHYQGVYVVKDGKEEVNYCGDYNGGRGG